MRRTHAITLVLLGAFALATSLATGGTALALVGVAALVAGTAGLLLDVMPEPVDRDAGQHPSTLRHPFLR
jgi:hypothetical protein